MNFKDIWRKKSTKIVASILGTLLLLGGVVGFFQYRNQKEKLAKIISYKLEERPLVKTLYLAGRVRPKSSMVITPSSSGHITELLVEEGAQVQKGAPLFSMRLEMQGQDDLLRQRSEVKELELHVSALQRKVDDKSSVSNLLAGSVLIDERNELEQARNRLQTARERLAVVEQDLGLNKEKQTKKSGPSGERSVVTINAPADGIITLIDKQPGDFVSAGNRMVASSDDSIVMVIADMGELTVRTKVLEADLRSIKLGQTVNIKLDAYPGENYIGAVAHIGGQGRIERTAGYTYFDVDVALQGNPSQILPEMNANIEIQLDAKEQTKVLPLAAVAMYSEQAYVLLTDQKTEKEKVYTPVKVGIKNEKDVEILEGLDLGDEVLEIDFSVLPLDPKTLKTKENPKLNQVPATATGENQERKKV